jgi:plasmid stabilization system protein ParE
MSYRVFRSPRATEEIRRIAAYLEEHSLPAAERFLDDLQRMQRQLSEFPRSGAPGMISGTRRIILGDYIVSYRLRGEAVEVFAVRHGRRGDARL